MRGYRPSWFSDEEDEVLERYVPPDRDVRVRRLAHRARAGLPLFSPAGTGAATGVSRPLKDVIDSRTRSR